MSMKSISIVFEKKDLIKNKIWNLKFVVTSKALFSAFRREKFEIFDVSFDLWFRIRAQRVKRQKFDDESQMMRKTCLNSIFFFFTMIRFFFNSTFSNNLVKFSRCAMRFILFVDVSSSLLLQRIFRFRKTWSRRKDLFTKRRFYRTQNTLLNLESVSFNLRNAVKRRKCDKFSSIIQKLVRAHALSCSTTSWFIFLYD